MSELETELDAIVTVIQGLALELNGLPVTVEKVKGHEHRDGRDAPVRITVAKTHGSERYTRWTFRDKRIDFNVTVTIQSPTAGPKSDLATLAAWRQSIMDAFDKPPLPGAPNVFELTAVPLDFEGEPGQQKMWDLQGVEVLCSTTKPY